MSYSSHDNLLFKQVLTDTDNRFFVGREKEVRIFKNCLAGASRAKKILNIHATAGMGKSYLVDHYQRISIQYGARFILINSRDFAHSPEHMLHRIYELLDGEPQEHFDSNVCIHHINQLAMEQLIILAFDTYEEMKDLDRWLQEQLIGNLDHRILIVISGRYPLQNHWFASPGWRELIEDLPLQEFSHSHTIEYLAKYNIKDMTQINAIYNLTHGHPLTLSLSASMINHNPNIREETFHPSDLFHSLTDQWLKEVKSAELRYIIESISLLRRFDQDILSYLLKEGVSDDLFEQITSYSFIRLGRRGWMMHDLMRNAISLNLRNRSPKRYKAINQAIAAFYFRQIEENDLRNDHSWLLSEFFYHLEDYTIRAIFYDTASNHHFQIEHVSGPAAEEARQYLKNLKHTSLYEYATFSAQHAEESEAVQLIASTEYKQAEAELLTRPSFLDSDHNEYILLKQSGKILGLALVIPIHENSLDFLASEPVTRAFFHSLTAEERAKYCTPVHEPSGWYIRMMDAIDPKDAVARSAILQELLQILFKGKVIVASNPLPFYQQLLERLGFHQVEGATHKDYGPTLSAPTQMLDIKSMGLENYLQLLASNVGIPLQKGSRSRFSDLTERENEIANLIVEGTPNKTIAEKLFVSEVTIKKHLSSIYRKKQIKNRAQLVKLLMDEANR
ncbi:LuxR family transcriptional regulator [Paenibacillus sp. J5C_2022]|uniref:LuxR family transcriptional regulator n=1 Tax=Paenibacillus sp. J5C2022 TaxID=2977129 RepID=UPI0021D3BB4E|nr:LuxR family transcriptional regulator [Paenibacillus sp. J5C2022]MCU6707537.1 LuxR family transcriptional regulator [Paenibacillus sp. J5C2022]